MPRYNIDVRVNPQGVIVGTRTVNRQLNQTARRADRLRNSISRLFGSLGAAITGVFLVRRVAQFEQAMSTVLAVTQATRLEFRGLREEAQRLGRTTRFSARQAAEGMVELARAGFDAAEVLGAIEGTLRLAQAGALELGRAADIATNVLTSFQLAVSQTGRIVDVLALASTNANTNIEQLGNAFKFVGGVARSFGVSVEESAAAIAVLSNNGLKAEIAGTGLRRVIVGLLAPTKAAREIYDTLGISLEQVDPRIVGLAAALGRLRRAGVDAGAAVQLFGFRGGPAFEALASGLTDVERLTEEFRRGAGAAAEIARVMDDNLNGAMLRAASAAEGLLIGFANLGATSALTQTFEEIARGLNFLVDNIEIVEFAMVGLVAVIATRLVVALGVYIRQLALVRAQAVATVATTLQKANAARAQAAATLAVAEAQAYQLTLARAAVAGTAQEAAVVAGLTNAKVRLTAARTADAAATHAQAAANLNYVRTVSRTGLVLRGFQGILTSLGGPLGLLTTALALGATAWFVWGNAAKEASDELNRDVAIALNRSREQFEQFNTLADKVFEARLNATRDLQDARRRGVSDFEFVDEFDFGARNIGPNELIRRTAEHAAEVGELSAEVSRLTSNEVALEQASRDALNTRIELIEQTRSLKDAEAALGVVQQRQIEAQRTAADLAADIALIRSVNPQSTALAELTIRLERFRAIAESLDVPVDTLQRLVATLTVDDLEGTDFVRNLNQELEDLVHQLNPVDAAIHRFLESSNILYRAFEEGIIPTIEEFHALVQRLSAAYRDAVNPVAAIRRELEGEISIFATGIRSRRTAAELFEIERNLREDNVELSRSEREQILALLVARESLNNVAREEERIYSRILGPIEDYRDALEATARLSAEYPEIAQRRAEIERDILLRLLNTRTDLEAGVQRGLIRVSQGLEDFATIAERTVRDALDPTPLDIYTARIQALQEAMRQQPELAADFVEAMRQARLDFLDTETSTAAGIERAIGRAGDQQGLASVAEAAVEGALNPRPIEIYIARLQALNTVLEEFPDRAAEVARAQEDANLVFLDTQTTVIAGVVRGLIRLERSYDDLGTTAEAAIADAFSPDPVELYRVRMEALARAVSLQPELFDAAVEAAMRYRLELRDGQESIEAGFERGFLRISEDINNFASLAERTVTNAFSSMEDALIQFVTTGKLEFADLVNSIVADLARLAIRQAITGPLFNALAGSLSGAFGFASFGAPAGAGPPPGSIRPPGGARGGFVTGPGTSTSDSILARLSRGEYVVNAAATSRHIGLLERINRAPRYQYGGLVSTAGPVPPSSSGIASNGGTVIQVFDQRSTNAPPVEVERSRGPDGRETARIFIRDTVREQIAAGDFNKQFDNTYGQKPSLR